MLHRAGIACYESQANFVLALPDDETALLARLRAAGVIARPGSVLARAGAVRISVPDEVGL